MDFQVNDLCIMLVFYFCLPLIATYGYRTLISWFAFGFVAIPGLMIWLMFCSGWVWGSVPHGMGFLELIMYNLGTPLHPHWPSFVLVAALAFGKFCGGGNTRYRRT